MAERSVNRGRIFVGVSSRGEDAGLGDPREELDFMVQNCDRLVRRLRDVSLKLPLSLGVGRNYANRPYLKSPIKMDRIPDGLLEEAQTAQLELAWIFGKKDLVNEIVKREK